MKNILIGVVFMAQILMVSLYAEDESALFEKIFRGHRNLIGLGITGYIAEKGYCPTNVIMNLRESGCLGETNYQKLSKAKIDLYSWEIPFSRQALFSESRHSKFYDEIGRLGHVNFHDRPLIWIGSIDGGTYNEVYYFTFNQRWKMLDRTIFIDYLKGTFEILDALRKKGDILDFPKDWSLGKFIKPIDPGQTH
ncbi:MAG: hypothetical protein PHV34_21285 [Verrucomicrobiae bacterium]|nr:hypothetical protein [Verrucomicrobiae bacterium]